MRRNSRAGGIWKHEWEEGKEPTFDFVGDIFGYLPLFCLAEPPDDYFDTLNSSINTDTEWHATIQSDTRWLAVSSSAASTEQLLSEIKSHIDQPISEPTPLPFLGSTIPQVYHIYKSRLQQARVSNRHHIFTNFSFLVVDHECFQPALPSAEYSTLEAQSAQDPSQYTILICSDASDFGESETEVRLKVFRYSFKNVSLRTWRIDKLLETPSEAHGREGDGEFYLVMMDPLPGILRIPPYTMDEDQEYRAASVLEARVVKRRAIMAVEAAGWVFGVGIPNDPDRRIQTWYRVE